MRNLSCADPWVLPVCQYAWVATAEEVPFARAAITRFCEHLEIDDELTERVRLAATDACTNCVLHAYGEDAGSATYTLDACRYRGVLRLTVSDDGRGIEDGRPNKHDDPGFGMGLIEQLADRSTTSARPNGGRRVAMQFDLAR